MAHENKTCLLTGQQLIDEYFMEQRNNLLEIAAFLDRLDRSPGEGAEDDFRLQAMRTALKELLSDEPGRIDRIQQILSDPDVRLLEERDVQGAYGAHKAEEKQEV